MKLKKLINKITNLNNDYMDHYFFDKQMKEFLKLIEKPKTKQVLFKSSRQCGVTDLLARYLSVKLSEKKTVICLIDDSLIAKRILLERIKVYINDKDLKYNTKKGIKLTNGSEVILVSSRADFCGWSFDYIVTDIKSNETMLNLYPTLNNTGKIIRNVSFNNAQFISELYTSKTNLFTFYWELSEHLCHLKNENNTPKWGVKKFNSKSYKEQKKLLEFGLRGTSDWSDKLYNMMSPLTYYNEIENLYLSHKKPSQ